MTAILIYLSEETKDKIKKIAKEKGFCTAPYCRALILKEIKQEEQA